LISVELGVIVLLLLFLSKFRALAMTVVLEIEWKAYEVDGRIFLEAMGNFWNY